MREQARAGTKFKSFGDLIHLIVFRLRRELWLILHTMYYVEDESVMYYTL